VAKRASQPDGDGATGTLAWDLVENAEGFLCEAVAYVERGQSRDWVFAVVNLAIALELALKAVLQSEHWTLVFEDLGSASNKALRSGHFRSVGYLEALRRCQQIAGLGLEPKDARYLEQLYDLRNRVLHYEFNLNVEQIKGVIARSLNIFNHVVTKRLRRANALTGEISARLVEFEGYVAERMRRLESRLRKSRRPPGHFRECPRCLQDALILQESLPVCLFCGASTTSRVLASCSEADMGPCPDCADGRLGFVLCNNDEGCVMCVLCGFRSESGHNRTCDYCGKAFWDETGDGIDICSDCYEAKMDDD